MITGDNALTASAIALKAGMDDFLAEAKPEDKLARCKKEQLLGHRVAMTGDGANDAPVGAAQILARNLFIYGLGGILLPFIGIKVIDMIITTIGLA